MHSLLDMDAFMKGQSDQTNTLGTNPSPFNGDIHGLIDEVSLTEGVDPELVRALVKLESGFNPNAKNPGSSASGLMQLVKGTAAEMGVQDVFDPKQNLTGGVRYLKKHLDSTGGDVEKALAMYNQGPAGDLSKAQGYVDKIKEFYGKDFTSPSTPDLSSLISQYGVDPYPKSEPFKLNIPTIPSIVPEIADDGSKFRDTAVGRGFTQALNSPQPEVGKLPFGIENKGGPVSKWAKDVLYGLPEGLMTLGAGLVGLPAAAIGGTAKAVTSGLEAGGDTFNEIAATSMGHPQTATAQYMMKPFEVIFGGILNSGAEVVKDLNPDATPEELESKVKATQFVMNLAMVAPMFKGAMKGRGKVDVENPAKSLDTHEVSPEAVEGAKAQVLADPDVPSDVKAQVGDIDVGVLQSIQKKAATSVAKDRVQKAGVPEAKFPENQSIVEGLLTEVELREGRAKTTMRKAAQIVAQHEGDIALADLSGIKGINVKGSTGKAIARLVEERDALKKGEEIRAKGVGDDVPLGDDTPIKPVKSLEDIPDAIAKAESSMYGKSDKVLPAMDTPLNQGDIGSLKGIEPESYSRLSSFFDDNSYEPLNEFVKLITESKFENDVLERMSRITGAPVESLTKGAVKIGHGTTKNLVLSLIDEKRRGLLEGLKGKGGAVDPINSLVTAIDPSLKYDGKMNGIPGVVEDLHNFTIKLEDGREPSFSIAGEVTPEKIAEQVQNTKDKFKPKEEIVEDGQVWTEGREATQEVVIPEFDDVKVARDEGYSFALNKRFAKLEDAQAKVGELGEGHEVVKVGEKYRVAKFEETSPITEFADEGAVNRAGLELMSEIPADKVKFESPTVEEGFGLAKVGDKYYRTSPLVDMPERGAKVGKSQREPIVDGVSASDWEALKAFTDEATLKELRAKDTLKELANTAKLEEVKSPETSAALAQSFVEWRDSYVTKCNVAKPSKKSKPVTKESLAPLDDNFKTFKSMEDAKEWVEATGAVGELIPDPLTGKVSFMNTEKLKGLEEMDLWDEGVEQFSGMSESYSDGMLSSDDISYAFGDFFKKFKKPVEEIAQEVKPDTSIKVDIPERYTRPAVEFPRSGKTLPSGELPATPFEDFLTTATGLKDAVTRSVEYIEEASLRALADRLAPEIPADYPLTLVSPGVKIPGGVPISLGSGSIGAVWFREGQLPKTFLRTSEFGEAGTTPKTLLHEAVHTIVNDKIDYYNNVKYKDTRGGRAVQDLYKLQNVIAKELNSRRTAPADPNNRFGPSVAQVKHEMNNPELIAGSFNINEVLTYGLTSPEFQAFLRSIPYETTNVFNKFVDTIRKLIGLDVNSKTALDEVIRLGDEFIELAPKGEGITPEMELSATGVRDLFSTFNNERGSVDVTPLYSVIDAVNKVVADAKKMGKSIDDYLAHIGMDEVAIAAFKAAMARVPQMKEQLKEQDPVTSAILMPEGKVVAQTVIRNRNKEVKSVGPPITEELANRAMSANRSMQWGTDIMRVDPETGKVRVEHTTNAFEKAMQATEVKINSFRAAGLSEIYSQWREAKSAAEYEKGQVKEWLDGLESQIAPERREAFALAAYGDMKSVKEALDTMGITEIPELTPKESAVLEQLFDYTRKFRDRANYIRTHTGQKAIPQLKDMSGRENYLPLMRDLNVLRDMGLTEGLTISDSKKLGELSKKFNGMFNPNAKKRNVSDIPIELDPFKALRRHADYGIAEIHISPVAALAKDLANLKLPRPDGVKGKISLVDWNPNLSRMLSRWSDQIVGKDVVATAMANANPFFAWFKDRLSKNLVVATIGGSLRTVLVQPTSYIIGIPTMLDMRSAGYGIAKLMSERPFGKSNARQNSSVLAIREADYAFKELSDYIQQGKMSGTVGYLAEKSLAPMKWVDSVMAEAGWNAARYYGEKRLKLQGKELYRFADDVVERTQGLGIKGAVSDVQSSAATKWLTLLQTFAIADFNLIARDVLGIKNPEASQGKTIMRVAKYTAATILAGQMYKMMGLDNVVPDPIGAYEEAKKDGKGDLRAVGAAAGELLEKVPLIGGSAKYSSSLFGIAGEWGSILPEAGEKFAASLDWKRLTPKQRAYNIKLIARAVGMTAGVPMTNQILKSINAYSKGGNPYQVILGVYEVEKKKKGGLRPEIPRPPRPPRPF